MAFLRLSALFFWPKQKLKPTFDSLMKDGPDFPLDFGLVRALGHVLLAPSKLTTLPF